MKNFLKRLNDEWKAKQPTVEGAVVQDGLGREIRTGYVVLYLYLGMPYTGVVELIEWDLFSRFYSLEIKTLGVWMPEYFDPETKCVRGGLWKYRYFDIEGKVFERSNYLWILSDSVEELYL